jgi:membrane protein
MGYFPFMSVQTRQLNAIQQRIRRLRERERTELTGLKRRGYRVLRWLAMLHHEFIRDDVRVRAESMSFLMIFSLLPLIAGLFFLFSIFSQFGLVQDALGDMVHRFLLTIPEAHRGFVQDYVLRFKDAYLSSLQEKSGSIGIFALFILIWVGLQLFRNVDKVLNEIWSAERKRLFFEQFRNFLVVSIAAPIALIAALSIPLILKRTPFGTLLFETVPFFAWLMNAVITPVLLFGTFTLIYRFVPVCRVRWRSALWGAVFSTIALMIANQAVDLYFRHGTQGAYGKAAVVPILGFWMYLVWIIVILGAEVSYLYQNGRDLLVAGHWDPTLREGEGLLTILVELWKSHRDGTNPVEFERLRSLTSLPSDRLHGLIHYLERTGLILECAIADAPEQGAYALARDLSDLSVAKILGAFFQSSHAETPIGEFWNEAVSQWVARFTDTRVSELAGEPARKRPKKPRDV